MIMVTMKNLMTHANQIAKSIVNKTENYQIAMSFALKFTWAEAKANQRRRYFTVKSVNHATYELTHKVYVDNPKFRNVGGMYAFFVDELINEGELDQQLVRAINLAYSYGVKRETNKAVLIEYQTDFGDFTVWAPKKMCCKNDLVFNAIA